MEQGNKKIDFTDIRKGQSARILQSYKETDNIVKNLENTIEKGHKATMSEIREWGSKRYKKQMNGKWMEISALDKTKKEHENQAKIHEKQSLKAHDIKGQSELAENHKTAASKLSDKEHTDEEVGLGDSAETKAFKHNHTQATLEQREHVAEKYFGDKTKDLTSAGRHHHEQLSDMLYEKMQKDKQEKVAGASNDPYEDAQKKLNEKVGVKETDAKNTLKKDIKKSEEPIMFSQGSEDQQTKMKKVMGEFKEGTLKTSSGEVVTNRDQAIAIAMSEAKLEKADTDYIIGLNGAFDHIASSLNNVQNKLEHCHRQTSSEPRHSALGDAYSDFASIKDSIIEHIIGMSGKKYENLNLTPIEGFTPEMCNDVAEEVCVIAEYILAFAKERNYSSVENLAQDLCGVGAKLKYKLTLDNSDEGSSELKKAFEVLGFNSSEK